MANFSEGPRFATSAGSVTLDPRLLDIVKTAASAYGLDVQAFSGVQGRSTGTKNHPGGWAIDVKLVDPSTGKVLPNYQNAKSFKAYEQFAQTARIVQQQKYPELGKTFRWGGYFAGGPNPMDLMHFDINPHLNGAMGGGSWDGGASPAFRNAHGIVDYSDGLGTPGGIRLASAVRQTLSTGAPLPPANIPNAAPVPRVRPASLSMSSAPTPFPAPTFSRGLSPQPGSLAQAPQDASFGVRVPNPGRTTVADLTMTPGLDFGSDGTRGPMTDDNIARLLTPAGRVDPVGPGPRPFVSSAPSIVPPVSLADTRAEQRMMRAATPPATPVRAAPGSNLMDIHDARDDAVTAAMQSVARQAPQPQPAPSFARQQQQAPAAAVAPAIPTVRLASGQRVQVGMVPSSDGTHVLQISDDGQGNAVIKKLSNPGEIPGVIDPLREANSNTVAGGLIRSQLPKIIADNAAGDGVGYAADNLRSSALDAANGIGRAAAASGVGDLVGNVFSGFGSMFGGGSPAYRKFSAPTLDETRAEQRAGRLVMARPMVLNTAPTPMPGRPAALSARPAQGRNLAFGINPNQVNDAVTAAMVGQRSIPQTGQLIMTDNGPQVIGMRQDGSPRGRTITNDNWFNSVTGRG